MRKQALKLTEDQKRDLNEMMTCAGYGYPNGMWTSQSERQQLRKSDLIEWGSWVAGAEMCWRLTDRGVKVCSAIEKLGYFDLGKKIVLQDDILFMGSYVVSY